MHSTGIGSSGHAFSSTCAFYRYRILRTRILIHVCILLVQDPPDMHSHPRVHSTGIGSSGHAFSSTCAFYWYRNLRTCISYPHVTVGVIHCGSTIHNIVYSSRILRTCILIHVCILLVQDPPDTHSHPRVHSTGIGSSGHAFSSTCAFYWYRILRTCILIHVCILLVQEPPDMHILSTCHCGSDPLWEYNT